MSPDEFSLPLTFEPLFMERVWGGRQLETLYAKPLPPGVSVGESWEIVDRAEAQSVVAGGPHRGRTLHELWREERRAVFGDIPDAPRFPLLIKILDAREKLSVQVHPPASIAPEFGGEPKTEFWYVASAAATAELYVGLTSGASREGFKRALERGEVAGQLQRLQARAGDSMFLPSGRVHAIGGGNVIFEIQQNSDTTFRVFDWNRTDAGKSRALHVAESLRSIDFADVEPTLVAARTGLLADDPLFRVEHWQLDEPRRAELEGRFAVLGCVSGKFDCAGVVRGPGEFCLLPAALRDDAITPRAPGTALLRIAIPR